MSPNSPQYARNIQQILFAIKAQQDARQEAICIANEQQHRIKQEASVARMIAQMQQFLTSGDPILVAEALAWAQVNPGILNVDQLTLPSSPPMEAENID